MMSCQNIFWSTISKLSWLNCACHRMSITVRKKCTWETVVLDWDECPILCGKKKISNMHQISTHAHLLWSTWCSWNVHGGWFCASDPKLSPHSLLLAALEEAGPRHKKERTSCCCLSSLSKHFCKYGQLTSACYICGKCSEVKLIWRSQRSVLYSTARIIFKFLLSYNLFSPISNCSIANIFTTFVPLWNGTHFFWRAGVRVVVGRIHHSLIYLVKLASHGDT